MATTGDTVSRKLVISETLCFLTRKRGRYADDDLKSILYNFYNGNQLAAAKELLVETVTPLNVEAIKKSLRRRRDSKEQPDVKAKHDIDDILAIVTYLDENKLTEQIPMFVAADPDLIPSVRLGDGDMLAILNKLGGFDERFNSMQSELETTRALLMRSMASGAARGGGQNNGAGGKKQPTTTTVEARADGGSAFGETVAIRGGLNLVDLTDGELSSARDSEYDMEDKSNFTTQMSRGARRAAKRQRASDSPVAPSYAELASAPPIPGTSVQTTRRPTAPSRPQAAPKKNVVIGQSTSCSMKAAKNLNVAKAVYRIGNIDACYNADDLKQYVESLGVRVLSCFERTSPNNHYEDNKSFRICIWEMDKSKLLCGHSWTVGISISPWVFKPKVEGGERGGVDVGGREGSRDGGVREGGEVASLGVAAGNQNMEASST